jgi:hypothetical protein
MCFHGSGMTTESVALVGCSASNFVDSAEPLIHMSFCPDNVKLARLSGSFAPCPVSALAGRHDVGDVISLCDCQSITQTLQCSPNVV